MANADEKAASTKDKRKFPLAKLQEHCKELFGVSSSTFAGATTGKKGDYTIDEVKKFINDWNGKGAK